MVAGHLFFCHQPSWVIVEKCCSGLVYEIMFLGFGVVVGAVKLLSAAIRVCL